MAERVQWQNVAVLCRSSYHRRSTLQEPCLYEARNSKFQFSRGHFVNFKLKGIGDRGHAIPYVLLREVFSPS